MRSIISLDYLKLKNQTEDAFNTTKAGKSFTERFSNALIKLELLFDKELATAKVSSEVKIKLMKRCKGVIKS